MHILPQTPLGAQRSHSSHTGRRVNLPPQRQTRHGHRVVRQRPNTGTTLVGERQERCLQYLTDFARSRKTQAPNTCYRFVPSCLLQRVILHPPQSSQCWIRGGGHTHATWTTKGGQQNIGANMSTKLPQGTHIMNRLRHNATRSCMRNPNWNPHTE